MCRAPRKIRDSSLRSRMTQKLRREKSGDDAARGGNSRIDTQAGAPVPLFFGFLKKVYSNFCLDSFMGRLGCCVVWGQFVAGDLTLTLSLERRGNWIGKGREFEIGRAGRGSVRPFSLLMLTWQPGQLHPHLTSPVEITGEGSTVRRLVWFR